MEYLDSFVKETGIISKYGENAAFIVWSMGLYFNTSDLQQLATESLTDCSGDKKIDFLRIDEEQETLYVVQGYYTKKEKEAAPSNKASDLNSAVAWLTDGDISAFPAELRNAIKDARSAIQSKLISQIELIFVHNCGESTEVEGELRTAATHLHAQLTDISVDFHEFGNNSLNTMFLNQAANIAVTDKITCPFPVMFEENSTNWKSAVLTIDGKWLRDIFTQYKGQLFSANYRSYLGTGRKYINSGIKNTAEHSSPNFWAYNNGITILTLEYSSSGSNTVLQGISIINGAQTTGSIGSIPISTDLSNVKILTRIIQCKQPELIGNIVKYNNTQNHITAWDEFSNEPNQIEISRQFSELGHTYNYRRGFENHSSILSIESSIQPLLSFIGKYKDANRSKSNIFNSRSLYLDAFDKPKARHILFVHCLNSCLQEIKSENKRKIYDNNQSKSESDQRIYLMFSSIKSSQFIIAIIGEVLTKLFTDLSCKQTISFTPNIAKAGNKTYQDIVSDIKPFISFLVNQIANYDRPNELISHYSEENILSLISSHVEGQVSSLMSSMHDVDEMVSSFKTMICAG